jgi:hypothetical protein
MSAATDNEDAQEERPESRRAAKAIAFGWSLYQQVAAVLGAIGMAALVDHYWCIGWRGWLMGLVGVWGLTVRPAMAWVFHGLVTVPLGWLGIHHFEVSQVLRDYFSVGLIVALSTFREVRKQDRKWWSLASSIRRFRESDREFGNRNMKYWFFVNILNWPPALLLDWPLIIATGVIVWFATPAVALLSAFGRYPTNIGVDRRLYFRTVLRDLRIQAPLFYLGILLALNEWALK